VLRRSTHGPARRSHAPRRATRGPWPRLRYCLITPAPPRPRRRLPIKGDSRGGVCRFMGIVAPAGIPSQARPVGPPGHGSRPARSGALVLPAGYTHRSGRAPLCSRACGSLHSSTPIAHRGESPSSYDRPARPTRGAFLPPSRDAACAQVGATHYDQHVPRFPCRSRAGGTPTPSGVHRECQGRAPPTKGGWCVGAGARAAARLRLSR